MTGEIEKGDVGKAANAFSSEELARTARENGPVDESTWTSRRWHRREPGSHPWRQESTVSRIRWSSGIVLEEMFGLEKRTRDLLFRTSLRPRCS